MKVLFSIILLAIGINVASADDQYDPVGWHWYNTPLSQAADQNQQNLSSLNPTQKLEVIQKGYKEALDAAVINPTEQNVAQYLEIQEWIEKQSALFAAAHPKVLLDYPQLDSHIQNPTEQIATQLVGQQLHSDQQAALKQIAATNGILFFYRGGNQMDELMCQVVSQFAQANQIAIIPVSIDGQISEFFPNSRTNNGEAQALGLKYFPATILINPETHQAQPVAYGFLSQDELMQRFLLIANNFKPTYLGGN